MRYPSVLLLVAPLHAQVTTSDPAPDGTGALAVEVQLGHGEVLLDYAWDGQPEVPFLRADPRVRVEYGERGLRADQLLYLPGNTHSEASATGASGVVLLGVGFAEGRFGHGLAFAARSYAHYDLPAAPASVPGWALHLWLRPAAAGLGRPVLTLGPAALLRLQADGRLQVELEGGATLVSPAPLPIDAWTFVDLSCDRRQTRQVRLTVGEASVRHVLPDPAPALVPAFLKVGDLGRGGQGFVGTIDELALATTPLSTSGARALGQPMPAPGSHLFRWRTNLGQRSTAPAAGITRESVLDDAGDFARGERMATAVVGDELRWVEGAWRRLDTLGNPAARTTHALVALGGGRVFTFGGETRDTFHWPMVNTDDTWIFDGARRAWDLVPTTTAPAPRCHIPLAHSPDHDLVLLVGGWRNDFVPGEVFGDTWVYHVGSRRWEQRFPGGSPPGRVSDHGLVYVPSRRKYLMLSGGRAWFYDPVTDVWEPRPRPDVRDENGQPASYLFGASTLHALDPRTDEVLVFGGSYGVPSTQYADFTALYDVAGNRYTVIDRPVRPSPRARSGFAFDPRRGQFVLFGGVQDQHSLRHDDLWKFDPATREWREIRASNNPGRRGGYYGMAYDDVNDRFVLACGREAVDGWLDDTWVLTLDEQRTGTALYTFERPIPGPAQWFAETSTPGGSRVRFFFRVSSDAAEWSRWRPILRPDNARFVQVAAFLEPGPSGAGPSIRRMGFR